MASMARGTPRRQHPAHRDNGHSAHDQGGVRERLRQAFVLTLVILAAELIGGSLAHSLAVFADAGHVLTDVAALGMAWFAAAQAERPANAQRTYGYYRVGILAALANGLLLILIAGVIAFEAYHRLAAPQPVRPLVMGLTAIVPIAINGFIASRMFAQRSQNLNIRAAALHVTGDIGASAAVLAGAGAIALTGALWVDPIISVAIAVLIAVGAVRIAREALSILLESTPRGLPMPRLVGDIRGVRDVRDVHDLHVWTISSGVRALSCHVVTDDIPLSASAPILDALSGMLRDRYAIAHTTVQFESANGHASHTGYCACSPETCGHLYCELQPLEGDESPHPLAAQER